MNPTQAAQLYRQAVQDFQSASSGSEVSREEAAQSPFLDLVKEVSGDTMESLEAAEKISLQATAGKADLSEVAVAVAHAESTLKTVVTVRDRMISAYQEIMRMPI